MNRYWIAFIMAITLFTAVTTTAQEPHESSHSHSHKEHQHKHHIALFNGVTTNFSHEISAYAIGVDYEYQFNHVVGLVAMAEYVNVKPMEAVVGLGAVFHAFKNLKFITAPIVLFREPEHGDVHGLETKSNVKEAVFAFRFGVGYNFHIGKFSLSPVVNYDAGRTKELNYGIALGLGF